MIKHINDYIHAQLVPPDLSFSHASCYNAAENIPVFNYLSSLNKTGVGLRQ